MILIGKASTVLQETASRKRSFAWRVYSYSFLDEFIPLYAVYVLMFSDTGLNLGEIATLFSLWTVVGFAMELPSGVIADRLPRHHVMAFAVAIRAAGFAIWIIAPSFWAFAVGFVLWGTSTALTSGTWQALVYTELEKQGATEDYAKLMGISGMLRNVAVVASMLITPLLIKFGGYDLTGWTSAIACALGAPIVLSMRDKEHRPTPEDPERPQKVWHTITSGMSEIRGSRTLMRVLVISAALIAVVNFDEYMPLQARATGASLEVVPLLMLVPWVGMSLGGLAVATWSTVSSRTVGVLMALGVVSLAVGSLAQNAWGFVGIGIFYTIYRYSSVIADTRLQDAISGQARATIGSVSGFGSQVLTLCFFGFFGIGGTWFSIPELMAIAGVPLLLLSVAIVRWLPAAERVKEPRDVTG